MTIKQATKPSELTIENGEFTNITSDYHSLDPAPKKLEEVKEVRFTNGSMLASAFIILIGFGISAAVPPFVLFMPFLIPFALWTTNKGFVEIDFKDPLNRASKKMTYEFDSEKKKVAREAYEKIKSLVKEQNTEAKFLVNDKEDID